MAIIDDSKASIDRQFLQQQQMNAKRIKELQLLKQQIQNQLVEQDKALAEKQRQVSFFKEQRKAREAISLKRRQREAAASLHAQNIDEANEHKETGPAELPASLEVSA